MATGAAQMMLRCAFDGSLSLNDMEIERRPYHRNCGCALHNSRGACSDTCFQKRNISFPKKQPLNDYSLSITASKSSSQSSFLDDSSVGNSFQILSQSSFLDDSSVRNREDPNEALSRR